MKNKHWLLFFLCFCALFMRAQAPIELSKVDSGSIAGARYKILFPKNWKKKLIMYAHGYQFVGSPNQSTNPNLAQKFQPFLDRGFAVACSDFRKQGFALPEGIEDTEALRKYFFKTYGTPDTAFIAGHSMGGGVTIGTIEYFPGVYKGGLALCPLSSRPYLQTRKEFDLYAVFSVLFPGAVPPLSEVMKAGTTFTPTPMQAVFGKAGPLRQRMMQDSVKAKILAQRFDLKLADLPFTILFGEGVLRELVHQVGGNPFDNTNTLYSGFPDDWAVNLQVERLPAVPKGQAHLSRYDRTGNIQRPIVLMHTVYDQLISPQYAVNNFDNMVHQRGLERFLVVKFTNGQGHCAFSPEQTGIAFDALRKWTTSGQKPQPGNIE